jgi:RNA-directed DNA polymerase
VEQGMEESDIEGLATHGGPESCVDAREGGGEALTGGVQAGLSSREIHIVRGAHAVIWAEGHTAGGARREPPEDPARSKNHGMYASSTRENRESPTPPASRSGVGRSGKAEAVSPR